MNFDVGYEHFEQQQHRAQTAAQKNGKKVFILKRLKRDIKRKTNSLMTLQFSSRNSVIILKATETSVILSDTVLLSLQITRFMPSKKYQRLYK